MWELLPGRELIIGVGDWTNRLPRLGHSRSGDRSHTGCLAVVFISESSLFSNLIT